MRTLPEHESVARPTVSHVLGELTWLLTQSPRHASLSVADLSWLLMPPIALRQFHLFREGARPVGAALWAYPPAEAGVRLGKALPSAANPLYDSDWKGGERLWLVDLIAPFATIENRQIELMLADLMMGPFKGKEFRMLRIDPATGAGSPAVINGSAGQQLVAKIGAAMSQSGSA